MSAIHPRLFVTTGEPAGIGPDLLIQYAQQAPTNKLVVVANRQLLEERAAELNLPITLLPFDPEAGPDETPGPRLHIVDIPLAAAVRCGQLDPANSVYVLDTLREAVRRCQHSPNAALVTGPLHKGIINEAGIPFTGHTEFLAELTHSLQVVMMLACPGLRVVPVTVHLALRDAIAALDQGEIEAISRIVARGLTTDFGIRKPQLAVAALNPHAGEAGALGREEIDIIAPAVETLKREGLLVLGPVPADTLFHERARATYDAAICMYHDQALIPLKTIDFHAGVNITLGLPFVRTSPDHGTAFEIAGTGVAIEDSFVAALRQAGAIAERRAESRAGGPTLDS